MSNRPTVALIHASPASVAPAKAAFADAFPGAELWNLLDDRLVVDADEAGGLTPELHGRMSSLIRYALDGGASAVQLSCSMYGPVAADAAVEATVPVLASDQAMFDHVREAGVARVGVLGSLESAASDSAARLETALAGTPTSVTWAVAAGAAPAANAGDLDLLEERMVTAARTLAQDVDLVVIAQYSLSPTLRAVSAAVDVPVLSPPHLAATTLRESLEATR